MKTGFCDTTYRLLYGFTHSLSPWDVLSTCSRVTNHRGPPEVEGCPGIRGFQCQNGTVLDNRGSFATLNFNVPHFVLGTREATQSTFPSYSQGCHNPEPSFFYFKMYLYVLLFLTAKKIDLVLLSVCHKKYRYVQPFFWSLRNYIQFLVIETKTFKVGKVVFSSCN